QPGDRYLLDALATGERSRCESGLSPVPGVGLEILPGDPAVGTRAGHELQCDAEIPGPPPHRRRGKRLLADSARCGLAADTLTGLGPRGLATLSRGAGEGFGGAAIAFRSLQRCGLWNNGAARRTLARSAGAGGHGVSGGRVRGGPYVPLAHHIERHQFGADRPLVADRAAERDDGAA